MGECIYSLLLQNVIDLNSFHGDLSSLVTTLFLILYFDFISSRSLAGRPTVGLYRQVDYCTFKKQNETKENNRVGSGKAFVLSQFGVSADLTELFRR